MLQWHLANRNPTTIILTFYVNYGIIYIDMSPRGEYLVIAIYTINYFIKEEIIMAQLNIEQLLTKKAIPMVPQHYELDIRVLGEDEEVYNWLEDVVYLAKKGEIVLKGTMSEEWVIPQKKLSKYEYLDGKKISYEKLLTDYVRAQTADSSAITWMIQIPTSITGEVTTERGDTLKVNCPVNRKGQEVPHGDGDWVCCCDNNGAPTLEWGCWVVNGEVVKRTYRQA